ncbi:MAG TPA: helix-turn-helix domain-containing protein [Pseudoclavibacter sp.]|nr:helix-turn-helix domain-containing protein [Pseudoclavibacter sp.]
MQGAQLIQRAAAVIRAVADDSEQPTSIAHLARVTDLSEPTTSRILSALADEGFVTRTPNGHWRLGPVWYPLALAEEREHGAFWGILRHTTDELSLSNNATALGWARAGRHAMCAARRLTLTSPHAVPRIGESLPVNPESSSSDITSHMLSQAIARHDSLPHIHTVPLTWGGQTNGWLSVATYLPDDALLHSAQEAADHISHLANPVHL